MSQPKKEGNEDIDNQGNDSNTRQFPMTNIVDIDREVNVKLLEDELNNLSVEPPRCLLDGEGH